MESVLYRRYLKEEESEVRRTEEKCPLQQAWKVCSKVPQGRSRPRSMSVKEVSGGETRLLLECRGL